MVPPHRRECRARRLAQAQQPAHAAAPRGSGDSASKSGACEIDHADRAAGRRIVDRAEIEVAELLRRKEREAAPPDRHAGEIVGKVVVRGDARARAHPDACQAGPLAEVDVVRFMQAVEEVMHVDRRQIDGRGIGLVLEGVDLREDLRQLAARGAEVHLHRVVVEQPSACFRLPDRNDEGHVAACCRASNRGLRAPTSGPPRPAASPRRGPRTTNGVRAPFRRASRASLPTVSSATRGGP